MALSYQIYVCAVRKKYWYDGFRLKSQRYFRYNYITTSPHVKQYEYQNNSPIRRGLIYGLMIALFRNTKAVAGVDVKDAHLVFSIRKGSKYNLRTLNIQRLEQ